MGTPTLVTRAALNQNGSIFHSWIQVHWVALMVIGTGRRLPRIAALALGEHSLFAIMDVVCGRGTIPRVGNYCGRAQSFWSGSSTFATYNQLFQIAAN